MKSSSDEVLSLVDEYNEQERLQSERLTRLFRMMRDRNGGTRFVSFSDGTRWTVNAFQPSNEAISLPRFVGELSRGITGCEPGEDGTGEARDESGERRFIR